MSFITSTESKDESWEANAAQRASVGPKGTEWNEQYIYSFNDVLSTNKLLSYRFTHCYSILRFMKWICKVLLKLVCAQYLCTSQIIYVTVAVDSIMCLHSQEIKWQQWHSHHIQIQYLYVLSSARVRLFGCKIGYIIVGIISKHNWPLAIGIVNLDMGFMK